MNQTAVRLSNGITVVLEIEAGELVVSAWHATAAGERTQVASAPVDTAALVALLARTLKPAGVARAAGHTASGVTLGEAAGLLSSLVKLARGDR